MKCDKCGNVNGPSATTCSSCGTPYPADAQSFMAADADETAPATDPAVVTEEAQTSEVTTPPAPPQPQPAESETVIKAADSSEAEAAVEEPTVVQCPGCKADVEPAEDFCKHCGAPLKEVEIVSEETSEPTDPETLREMHYDTAPNCTLVVTKGDESEQGPVKDMQEDSVLTRSVVYPFHRMRVDILIVTDGIGSTPSGELFADIAVARLFEAIRFNLPNSDQQHGIDRYHFSGLLTELVDTKFNAALIGTAKRLEDVAKAKRLKGSGCTVVAAIVITDLDKGHVVIQGYHEGDAGCFLISDDQVRELSKTSEHTAADGSIKCYFGNYGTPVGFRFSEDIWMPAASMQQLTIALASDGVAKPLGSAGLLELAQLTGTAQEFCTEAVKRSIQDDGGDNATAAAVRITLQETQS